MKLCDNSYKFLIDLGINLEKYINKSVQNLHLTLFHSMSFREVINISDSQLCPL